MNLPPGTPKGQRSLAYRNFLAPDLLTACDASAAIPGVSALRILSFRVRGNVGLSKCATSAETRGAVKAARFRAALVQQRA